MTNELKRQAVLEGLRLTMAASLLFAGTATGALAKAVTAPEGEPTVSNEDKGIARSVLSGDDTTSDFLLLAGPRCTTSGFLQFICQ